MRKVKIDSIRVSVTNGSLDNDLDHVLDVVAERIIDEWNAEAQAFALKHKHILQPAGEQNVKLRHLE